MATILCIEDEDALRSDIVEELEDGDYDTLQAVNGREGLETILAHHPDLVLCDINMPEMNGFELLCELGENHPRCADIPFIFLTAYTDRKWVLAGLDRGADDYLTKPVDFQMLLVKVKAALRRVKRMQDEKEREQVKLYKALAKDAGGDTQAAVGAPVNGRRLDIVLVGRADNGVEALRRGLESDGHAVVRIHSGKDFVDQAAVLTPDLCLIWFDTDDIRGDMAAKCARDAMPDRTTPLVLMWSPDMVGTPAPKAASACVDDLIQLPIADGVLRSKIRQWVPGFADTAA